MGCHCHPPGNLYVFQIPVLHTGQELWGRLGGNDCEKPLVSLKPWYHKRLEAKRILKPSPIISLMCLSWWEASGSRPVCEHRCFTRGRFATYVALAVCRLSAKCSLMSAVWAHEMHKNSSISANMRGEKWSYGNSLSHLELTVSQRKVAIWAAQGMAVQQELQDALQGKGHYFNFHV